MTWLGEIQSLYDRGRYRDAARALVAFFGGRDPETVEELELAARTASQLCRPIQAAVLQRRMWRRHPRSPKTLRHRVYYLTFRNRLLAALELACSTERHSDADDLEAALWWSARAGAHAALRDFERAEAAIERGLALGTAEAWLLHDRAWLRFAEDRLEEAVEICRELTARNPFDAHAAHLLGVTLHESGASEEAAEVLAAADTRFQAPRITAALASVWLELDRLDDVRARLEALLEEDFEPERGFVSWVHATLAAAARRAGDPAAALAHARRGGRPLRSLAARLERRPAGEARRVTLDVPFVRQDYVTCVPATLASVLAYFGRHVDQRAVAREITYDGTPEWKERSWCLRHGLLYREFQFETRAARALIDRGLPFTLVTKDALGAHQQAVVGYDTGMRTWLLREPGVHLLQEIEEERLVEMVRARGGRCALVAPPAQRHRLPEELLPLEAETTAATALHEALWQHRLEEAERCFGVLVALEEHPLRWEAERALAWYRGDSEAAVAAARAQFAAFPEDDYCRDLLARELLRAHRRRELEELLLRLHVDEDGSPVLLLHRVELLRHRAANLPRARRILRRVLRRLPTAACAMKAFADLLWELEGERGRAAECYRLASCLSPFDEHLAMAHFRALSLLGRTDEGLAFLRRREARLGERSGASSVSLAEALMTAHRTDEAVSVLRRASTRHEEEGLRAAWLRLLLDAGRREDARRLLAESEGKMRPVDLLLHRADLARREGLLEDALEILHEAAARNPADERVQAERLRLLAEVEGHDTAAVEAVAASQEHPQHPELARLAVQSLMEAGWGARAEQMLRDRLRAHPEESWVASYLTELLVRRGRAADALEVAREETAQLPHAPQAWTDLGLAAAAVGERDEAYEAFCRSLELWVDNAMAVHYLLQQADCPEAAARGLRHVARQILQQGPGGEALRAFAGLAREHLDPEELLDLLHRIEREFPFDPGPGEALCEALVELGRVQEAEERARALAARFPDRTRPLLVLDTALARLERGAERERVLQRALAIDPRCVEAWTRLGERCEASDPDRAETAYRNAIRANPGMVAGYGYLADLLWSKGEREAALATLEQALRVDPSYDWGMLRMVEMLLELQRPQEAVQRARGFTAVRAHRAAAHLALARALERTGDVRGRIAALEAAVAADPRQLGARDELVEAIAEEGDLARAREILEAAVARRGNEPYLRGRSIWLARREGEAGAVECMRALLAEHPDYAWGWRQLVLWLLEDDEFASLAELAEQPPAALAEDPLLYVAAGHAHAALEEIGRAERQWRRALEIAPAYAYARSMLADLYHERGDHQAEGRVLAEVDEESADPSVLARMVRHAAHLREDTVAERRLRLLLQRDDVDLPEAVLAVGITARELPQVWTRLQTGADSSPQVRAGLARAACAAGLDDALRAAVTTLREGLGALSTRALGWVAEAAHESGDDELCERALALLGERPDAPPRAASALRAFACLQRNDPAGARALLRAHAPDDDPRRAALVRARIEFAGPGRARRRRALRTVLSRLHRLESEAESIGVRPLENLRLWREFRACAWKHTRHWLALLLRAGRLGARLARRLA